MADDAGRIRRHKLFWKVVNPPTRPLAGLLPWWVLLETTGRRTGQARHTPLASGPATADGMWLIAVHGRHASWVRNVEASPHVRMKHRGRWRDGVADVRPLDAAPVSEFNVYARQGPRTMGIDPVAVYVDLHRSS